MEKVILTEKNFSRLKEFVKKNKNKEIIFSSEDDDYNRKVMEKLDINILLINLEGRKDYMKQRNSGFNQVMAKVAAKRGIVVGINFDELINSKDRERILSRIRQNVKLCNGNKVQMKFLGNEKRDIYSLKSLDWFLECRRG